MSSNFPPKNMLKLFKTLNYLILYNVIFPFRENNKAYLKINQVDGTN